MKRTQSEILENDRAEYGQEIVFTPSQHFSCLNYLVLILLKK